MDSEELLRTRIREKRLEVESRQRELDDLEEELKRLDEGVNSETAHGRGTTAEGEPATGDEEWSWPLTAEEYERYSRQMIVPNFGIQGQLRLRNARVLVVGAGGLGSPAAAYLAGAGVGTLGLVDGDVVEASNLHRQIAHATARVGMKKVDSAICYLRQLNPLVRYQAHADHLSTANAESIISQYDLVLDCTDHPTSRYLISDACVLLSKPLVSASAFQTSGQLVTLNAPPGRGPCYRCVFPKPPPPESVVGCGEGGIVGGVVGAMGVLQALEAVKLVVGGGLEAGGSDGLAAGGDGGGETKKGVKMLLFSGWGDLSFRVVRMRGKRADCFACGTDGITRAQLRTSMDYVQFCGVVPPVRLLGPEERVTPQAYHHQVVEPGVEHVLLDVREREHFDVCHMENAVNLPFSRVVSYRGEDVREVLPAEARRDGVPLYVVCQRGNDSQVVVRRLKEAGMGGAVFVGDIRGGTKAWQEDVDPTMPFT